MARALDVIGDRWNLLIVRELMLSPARFTDLQAGLPGIAKNLLADRLRALEEAGVIERRQVSRPLPGTLYHLTSRGEQLRPILVALGRWGAPFMLWGQQDDIFRLRWLPLVAEILYGDITTADLAPLRVVLASGEERVLLLVDEDGVRATPLEASEPDGEGPDVYVEADGQVIIDILGGQVAPHDAAATGQAVVRGSARDKRRLGALGRRAADSLPLANAGR